MRWCHLICCCFSFFCSQIYKCGGKEWLLVSSFQIIPKSEVVDVIDISLFLSRVIAFFHIEGIFMRWRSHVFDVFFHSMKREKEEEGINIRKNVMMHFIMHFSIDSHKSWNIKIVFNEFCLQLSISFNDGLSMMHIVQSIEFCYDATLTLRLFFSRQLLLPEFHFLQFYCRMPCVFIFIWCIHFKYCKKFKRKKWKEKGCITMFTDDK